MSYIFLPQGETSRALGKSLMLETVKKFTHAMQKDSIAHSPLRFVLCLMYYFLIKNLIIKYSLMSTYNGCRIYTNCSNRSVRDTSNTVYCVILRGLQCMVGLFFQSHGLTAVRKRRPATSTSGTAPKNSAKATADPATGWQSCTCSCTHCILIALMFHHRFSWMVSAETELY